MGNSVALINDKKASIAQRINSVRDAMESNKATIFQALPKHISPDRLMRVVISAITKNPKILDCTPESLFRSITEAASLGFEPGGVLGHAYLVPYGKECVLIPGYKGMIDLARRSANISTLYSEVVHECDTFSYQLGDDPNIHHVPDDECLDRDEKPITHVYAVVKLRDGGIQRKVWSQAKIDAHKRKHSQGWRYADGKKKDSPWHTDWASMAKKTVIRDMVSRGEIPVSVELQELANREEQFEAQHRGAPGGSSVISSLGELTEHIQGDGQEPTKEEPEAKGPPVELFPTQETATEAGM